jgi:hypothetical protein
MATMTVAPNREYFDACGQSLRTNVTLSDTL